MPYKKHRARLLRGITLLEAMIVLTLTLIFCAGGAAAIAPMVQFLRGEHGLDRSLDELNLACEYIKRDIVEADNITISGGGNTLTITHTDYTDTAKSRTIVYAVSGTKLQRTVQDTATPPNIITFSDITDKIDSAQLPVYALTSGNYLIITMYIKDDVKKVLLGQKYAVMARCRSTRP